MGSINIFEISRQLKIRATVVITSDKCYLNKEILRGYKKTMNWVEKILTVHQKLSRNSL